MYCAHTLSIFVLLCTALSSAAFADTEAHAKPGDVTREGIGSITKSLSLASTEKLRKVFNGCHISSSTKLQDRRPVEKRVNVSCHGKTTYVLRSALNLETLNSAETFHPGARSPEGVAIGDTLAAVYKLGQVDCDADVNPAVVRCVFLGDTAVAYSAEDTTKKADGLLPAEDDIKKLKITSIIWRANML